LARTCISGRVGNPDLDLALKTLPEDIDATFGERYLVREHGEAYEAYRRSVPESDAVGKRKS
jgi:hypothetical protein